MITNLTIRAKVWIVVGLSVLAILGLSISLLLQARVQFMDQLRDGSRNQVQMIIDQLEALHVLVQDGLITEQEAKARGRFLVNNTVVDERNYILLYHRHGLLLAHPFRGVDLATGSDAEILATVRAQAGNLTEAQRLEQSGYREPAPSMTEIISRYTGDSYTGFSEYMYTPEASFGYRLLTYADDPLADPQAELKTVYSELFAPWGWVVINGMYEDDVEANFFNWALQSALIILLILFVLCCSAYLMTRSIIQPLLKANAYMDDIAEGSGDLSQRLDESGEDELSQLGKGFNTFVDKLSSMIRQVLLTNTEVTQKAEQFSAMITRTSQRSTAQLTETEMLASSTTELSSSLSDVAEGAQASVDAAANANGATEKAARAVADTRSSVEELSSSLGVIQQKVHDMRVHNEKVNSVLDVIRGIADQTNLLALNAAIEAARAGDQGRGFAVVADEVRSLAQKTQASTQEINGIIENLQGNTSEIVTAMDTGVGLSKDCVIAANSANELLNSVFESVSLIADRNRTIASSVQQQSEVTDEIAKSSVKIASDGRLNTDDYKKCLQYHDDIKNLLSSLDDLLHQFKLGA
ncbi:MAG: methyl-accepting chemotaxis protein [Pseudomonadales bacterium]|nr:methyl-accepting chemotaxis protein [Pseudomonadales bacterium]